MKKSILAVALASTFIAPTFADDKSGFYLGLGAGKSEIDLDTPVGDFEEDSNTYNFFGGYRFNDYFALETEYRDFGDFDKKGGGNKLEIDLEGISVKAVGIYPINDSFELLGKVGLMYWETDATRTFPDGSKSSGDDDGTDLVYGIGAKYNLTKQVSFGLNWDRLDIDADNYDADVDTFTLSAQYNF